MKSKHYIGIDLGTTNCSLAVSTGSGIEDLSILQAVGEDLFDHRIQLPSFFYLPDSASSMKFEDYPSFRSLNGICGAYARELAVREPTRVIQSAKSWISLSNENSSNRILPFHPDSPSANQRTLLSPIEAQAKYLQHIFEQKPSIFEDASVVVTVPASFDERARNFTLESTRIAGLKNVTILEEPQAAFYDWLYYQKSKPRIGSTVLVVDIGGGTTDFSLLTFAGSSWKRSAVGDHLLLGGDNIDLALAYDREKLTGAKLDRAQWIQLLKLSRELKEVCLDDGEVSRELKSFSLIGEGSGLFSSEIKVQFSAQEVMDFILEGFFPLLGAEDWELLSDSRTRDLGLREFGLPYETNPNIPMHMLRFLRRYCPQGPDAVLFHGGTLKSKKIRKRLHENLCNLFHKEIEILGMPHPFLGVSHGACIYALAREGLAQRIQSGLAHNLYLEVEQSTSKSLFYCIARAGQEESEQLVCPSIFQLKGNQQIRFPLYRSRAIEPDEVGRVLENGGTEDLENQLISLSSVYANLDSDQNFIPVKVSTRPEPTGDISMELMSERSEQVFQLSFKPSPAQDAQKILRVPSQVEDLFLSHFGKGLHGSTKKGPMVMLKSAESLLSSKRSEWGVDLCRLLAKLLISRQKSRRKSEVHEQVWMNAVGFLMRPGFGHPLDSDLIRSVDYTNFTQFPKQIQNRHEYWIFMRRIAGGIPEEFQNTLFDSYGHYLFNKAPLLKLPGGAPGVQELKEMMRCFVSFEFLKQESKQQLLRSLVQSFRARKLAPGDWWLLSKILSRKMQYADFTRCLPPASALQFFEEIQRHPRQETELKNLLINLFQDGLDRSLQFDSYWIETLSSQYSIEKREIDATEQERYSFGEALPLGLKLVSG